MATRKQKEELVETLKFTPVTYTVDIYGYGGEIAVAKINKTQYDFWKPTLKDGDSALVSHCTAWEPTDCDIEVPKEAVIVTDAAWYETEGQLEHMSGCEFSDGSFIQVSDENGNDIYNKALDYEELEEDGVVLESTESYASNFEGVDYAFCFQSSEKGTFFSGDLHLRAPFDPSKLKITYVDVEGWELISSVEYDGEYIEGFDGYSTTGKGYYADVFEV